MSEFLDELARTLAKPMPRSRVVRVLGGSILAAVFPLARPGLRPAGAATLHRGSCGDPGTCANPSFPKVCGCDFLAGCYRDCCDPKTQICCTWKRAGGPGRPPCEKICCPKGTRCGSGEPGDVCVPLCPTRCGEKCCQKGEYCADPRRSLCCANGEHECQVRPPAGLPSTGKEPARCCPSVTPKCCSNDQRMACCDPVDNCCGGRCCPPDKQCTKGVCACPKGKTTCGRNCCDRTETCCPGKTACCKKTETCCGEECCGKGEKCCQGEFKHCCKENEGCCGGGCCRTGTVCAKREGIDVCCKKAQLFTAPGKRLFCCPSGTVPSRGGCCPPSKPDCCTGDEENLPPLPQKGKVCVNGTLVGI